MERLDVKINYSALIYQKRLELSLTQEKLSEGICSIPYLSKIENSKISPNYETLKLLLERLNINILEIEGINEEFNEKLNLWYRDIVNNNLVTNNLNKEHCTKFIKNIISPDTIYSFHLIQFLEYINLNEKTSAINQLEIIKSFKNKFNMTHTSFYHYFFGLFEARINKNYKAALSEFLKVTPYFNDYKNLYPEFYYHLSLVFTYSNKNIEAIDHAQTVLNIYNEQINFNRVIECRFLLAINLSRIGKHNEAINIYNLIIETEHIKETLKLKSLHNLGFLYKNTKNRKMAYQFFEKVLKFQKTKGFSFFNTKIELIELLIEDNRKNEAIKIFNTLKITNDIEQLIFTLMKLEIEENYDKLIIFLEDNVIKHFEKFGDIPNLKKYYLRLANLNYLQSQYKKSAIYYRKIITIEEKYTYSK